MGTENEIDQFFKRGLNDPEIPFNELDWERMERKLDKNKKRKIIPIRVITASGIAASLLIFLFWFLSGPSVPKKVADHQLAESKARPATVDELSGMATDTIKAGEPAGAHIRNSAGVLKNEDFLAGNNYRRENYKGDEWGTLIEKDHISIMLPVTAAPVFAAAAPIKTPIPARTPDRQPIPLTDSAILAQKAMALALSKDPLEKINHAEIAEGVKKKMDAALSQRHGLILSAMAAPDISSGPSGSSKSSKLSTNLGVLATYALGSKFSLTSGAIYAKKYYNYGPGGSDIYNPPAGSEWEVKADCNVIDVPVNVNYKVLDKKKFSVSVNTGLSSYFMLKEKYDYIVETPGQQQQVITTEIDNKNQHVFGIANVSVSFDHQISRNISVGLQPFAKLPLTGIGNYDINLKSTGVSFSLNIGLFPAKKPGKLAANRYSSLY
jgi:hypothetical protein